MTAPHFQPMIPESTKPPAVSHRAYWIALAVIVALGAFLRFYPSAAMKERRADELIYARSTENLYQAGLSGYPDLCIRHIEQQFKMKIAMPPPTRFLYPFFGYVVRSFSGWDAQRSLVFTSALFTTFTLLLAAGFARRLGGEAISLAVTGLLAVGMNQVHQSQHAMIDGFFATWALLALWSFWEILQQPNRRLWMVLYTVSLTAMVMTKENSFFVVMAIGALLVLNRWFRLGTVTPQLWLLSFLGPLAGFVVLIFVAGGVDVFRVMYELQLRKIDTTAWAIKYGDGPWYRYLLDLVLISPLIMLLAIGQSFQLRWKDKGSLLLVTFVLLTFTMMANIKYGLSVRYATIWDMPLRFLAVTQLVRLSGFAGRWATITFWVAALALAAFELNQYHIFCVQFKAYALTSAELLEAVEMVK